MIEIDISPLYYGDTWAKASPDKYLITPAHLIEWRHYLKGAGMDDALELSDDDTEALFVTYVDGDIQERHACATWQEYAQEASEGIVSGNLFRSGEAVWCQYEACLSQGEGEALGI